MTETDHQDAAKVALQFVPIGAVVKPQDLILHGK